MNVMTHAGVKAPYRAILTALRENAGPMTPEDLITAVVRSNPGVTDLDVKRTIWELIAQQELGFSSRQLIFRPLRLVSSGANGRKIARRRPQRSK